MTPRALLKPYVVMPRDASMVCTKTPITSPEDFLETNLTPDEAELYGLELMLDAKRARFYIESQEREAARAARKKP